MNVMQNVQRVSNIRTLEHGNASPKQLRQLVRRWSIKIIDGIWVISKGFWNCDEKILARSAQVEKISCRFLRRNSEVFKHVGAQDAADALRTLLQLSSIFCSREIDDDIDSSGWLKVRMNHTVSSIEQRAEYFRKNELLLSLLIAGCTTAEIEERKTRRWQRVNNSS